MLIAGQLVAHAERFASTLADKPTLRHLEECIAAALAEQESLRADVAAKCPDYLPEWDRTFWPDVERAEGALQIVRARLAKLAGDGTTPAVPYA